MNRRSLLEVRDLHTRFRVDRGFLSRKRWFRAVDGVSLDIADGEVLGLVGESGCGKTTLGRTLTRLEAASGGQALLAGEDILDMSLARFRPFRRHVQMIFQDPLASLNPRLSIERTLSEPLFVHGIAETRGAARAAVAEVLERVGMDPRAMNLHPHEFSGGQRQRIGIARAIILKPRLVIADEPVASLDVSIQAQVLNLIKQLQRDSGMAMLFISHDLGVVRHICDRVAVMQDGRIVELADKRSIFNAPGHACTRRLLQAIPRIARRAA